MEGLNGTEQRDVGGCVTAFLHSSVRKFLNRRKTMDDDVLSSDEIDDLLAKVNSEASDGETTADNDASQDDIDALLGGRASDPQGPMVKIYDFHRPSILTQDGLKTVSSRIESALERFEDYCRKNTGTSSSLSFTSFDALTIDEYRRSLPNPCLAFKIIPSDGASFFLEMSSSLGNRILLPFLGVSGHQYSPGKVSRILREAVEWLVKDFFTRLFETPVTTESITSPDGMRSGGNFEMVYTAVMKPEDDSGGMMTVTFPISSFLVMFRDVFPEFNVPPRRKIAEDITSDSDLWFERRLTFPVLNTTINNIVAFADEGGFEDPGYLTGRIGYKRK
jgi:flagellar motor switch protein FliM